MGGEDEGNDGFCCREIFCYSWKLFTDAVFVGGYGISKREEDIFCAIDSRKWGECVLVVLEVD